MESNYENSVKRKLEERKKALSEKKEAAAPQEGKVASLPKIFPPKHHMAKLGRLVLTSDEMFYTIPMHDFDLSWEMLVHTHRYENRKIAHIFCTDLLVEGSCEHCKKEGYEFEPKFVNATIQYVINIVGEKRSFTSKDGNDVTYYLNPANVVEIQADGKGGDTVIPAFKSFAKIKMFDKVIWGILREAGVPTEGRDGIVRNRGGGFVAPTTYTEEEVLKLLGKEGIEAKLPEYALAWSEMIKTIAKEKGNAVAKDEVFRYMITSFDNAEEVASLKKMDIPQKPGKPQEVEKATNNLMIN